MRHLMAWSVTVAALMAGVVLAPVFAADTANVAESDSALAELMPYAVAVWHFDEEEQDRTIRDASGNGHEGVMREGVTREPCDLPAANGWCLAFDGEARWQTYGYVDVPHDDALAFDTDTFTISIWVYREREDEAETLLTKGNVMTRTGAGYRLRFIDRQRFQSLLSGDGEPGLGIARTGVGEVPAGAWYHIVQVFAHNGIDWSDATLYINGELVQEATTAFGGSLRGDDVVRIGQGFKGRIAQLAVFNAALEYEQVERLYEEGALQ